MPGLAQPTNDERELLLAFLAQQRDGLRNAAYGLTEDQARRPASASTLSVASLLRHMAVGERGWMSMVKGGPSAGDQGFGLTDEDTLVQPARRLCGRGRRDRRNGRVTPARRSRSGPAACRGSPTTSTRGRSGGCCCT